MSSFHRIAFSLLFSHNWLRRSRRPDINLFTLHLVNKLHPITSRIMISLLCWNDHSNDLQLLIVVESPSRFTSAHDNLFAEEKNYASLFRLHNRTYDDDVSRKSMRYIAVLYLSFVTSDAIRAKCDTTWTCEMYELSSPIMLKIIFFCTFYEFSTLSSAGICSKYMTMSLTDVRVLGFCNHLCTFFLESWSSSEIPNR